MDHSKSKYYIVNILLFFLNPNKGRIERNMLPKSCTNIYMTVSEGLPNYICVSTRQYISFYSAYFEFYIAIRLFIIQCLDWLCGQMNIKFISSNTSSIPTGNGEKKSNDNISLLHQFRNVSNENYYNQLYTYLVK